jgi:hypothetical protein
MTKSAVPDVASTTVGKPRIKNAKGAPAAIFWFGALRHSANIAAERWSFGETRFGSLPTRTRSLALAVKVGYVHIRTDPKCDPAHSAYGFCRIWTRHPHYVDRLGHGCDLRHQQYFP